MKIAVFKVNLKHLLTNIGNFESLKEQCSLKLATLHSLARISWKVFRLEAIIQESLFSTTMEVTFGLGCIEF